MTSVAVIAIVAAAALPALAPKPPSPATIAAQQLQTAALPVDDGRDEAFAAQGFMATRTDPVIKDASGKPVWNLDAYKWMSGPSPASVNPSLWRHMMILRKHGLFAAAPGVWQVRGFDVSNMTVIAGKTGWIIVDPLTTKETASAALALVNEKLGNRQVAAVIYTHSHGDHFGGVRGVVSDADVKAGTVTIIAPDKFIEETASENVIAGIAMSRRANYQFGGSMTPGAQGQMGSGIGAAISGGAITLIKPTDTIKATGETRTIDGVAFEFQMVPETEAPSEMNIMLPTARTLLVGELTACSLHNILTPRGAKVRDALAWAGYLTEAIKLFADRADTHIGSHCWPRFGKAEVRRFLTLQRDNYKFLHDQSVRMMNKGMTPTEIAEVLAPPATLAREWFTRGYYGTYSHNSKAVYQRYLGWYDGVPANLNPYPPIERAQRYVSAMEGAAKVIAIAKTAMAAGDYRWASDVLNHAVFADPKNATARAMLADAYEQMGYQAEASTWRNMYLSAARDLRQGVNAAVTSQSADVVTAIPTGLLFDAIATRLDPAIIGDAALTMNLSFTDRSERAKISVGNAVMITETDDAHVTPDVSVSGPRQLFLGLFFLKLPLAQMEAAGLKIIGDRAALITLLAAIETPPASFTIAEP